MAILSVITLFVVFIISVHTCGPSFRDVLLGFDTKTNSALLTVHDNNLSNGYSIALRSQMVQHRLVHASLGFNIIAYLFLFFIAKQQVSSTCIQLRYDCHPHNTHSLTPRQHHKSFLRLEKDSQKEQKPQTS